MTAKREFCFEKAEKDCLSCSLVGQLMCSYEPRYLLLFLAGFLFVLIPAVFGIIRAGFALMLIPWLIFAVFFLQVWENRILCSHCPYYATEGRILRCHANYGLLKLWKYNPAPMSRSEQIQVLIGIVIMVGFPLPLLFLGQQYILCVVTILGIIIFAGVLIGKLCPKCLNFSCPLNRVPKDKVDAFLRRNPNMKKAWEAKGYVLDLPDPMKSEE